MSESQIARLWQRMQSIFALGRITATRDDRPTGSVQVALGPQDVRDDVPVLGLYGVTSRAPVGAEAVVLFLGGARTDPVVICTGDRQARRRNLAPGETAMHNANGVVIHLSASGIKISGGGFPIAITGAPQVTVAGGDVIADGVSLKNHIHTNVQAGSNLSGPPQA